ncbi:MAG: oligosaccharide flippase family protein, partial [Chitinophagales bacterium]
MMPLLASVVLLFPYTDNLPTSLYGELAIYISFTLLLQIFFNYGLDNYVGIHHFDFKNDPGKMKEFIGTIVTYLFIIGGVIILLFVVAGNVFFQFALDQKFSFYPYGFMSVITAFCNSFFRTYVNFLFYKDKAKKYFLLNFFNFSITIIICWVGLEMYPETLVGPMWGRLLSGFAIFLVAFILYLREYGLAWKPELLQGLQKFCLPVVLFFLLNWVALYINNFIINAFSTTSDVGIYDFALKCTLLIEFVQTGILGTINPRIYTLWKTRNALESSVEENRYHHVFSMFTVLFVACNVVLLP